MESIGFIDGLDMVCLVYLVCAVVSEKRASGGTSETSRMVGRVYLVCEAEGEAEGEAKIGYLATGCLVDSMAARIFVRDSRSNSCP
jgi:hypothetical protein